MSNSHKISCYLFSYDRPLSYRNLLDHRLAAGEEMLRGRADRKAAHRAAVGAQRGKVLPLDLDRAAIGTYPSSDCAQQCRLPRSVRSQESNDLPRTDTHRDALEYASSLSLHLNLVGVEEHPLGCILWQRGCGDSDFHTSLMQPTSALMLRRGFRADSIRRFVGPYLPLDKCDRSPTNLAVQMGDSVKEVEDLKGDWGTVIKI